MMTMRKAGDGQEARRCLAAAKVARQTLASGREPTAWTAAR